MTQNNEAFERWWYGTDASEVLHSRNSADAGWQASEAESDKEIAELKAENLAYKKENNLISHKLLTCGVAASHPDANLSKREADYGGKWDSPQAQEVRKLRDSHIELQSNINQLREALGLLLSDTQHVAHECGDTAVYCPVVNAKEVLATTPAQSLQAHDDEVLELCAKLCEQDAKDSSDFNEPFAANVADILADAIRNLKGKP